MLLSCKITVQTDVTMNDKKDFDWSSSLKPNWIFLRSTQKAIPLIRNNFVGLVLFSARGGDGVYDGTYSVASSLLGVRG